MHAKPKHNVLDYLLLGSISTEDQDKKLQFIEGISVLPPQQDCVHSPPLTFVP